MIMFQNRNCLAGVWGLGATICLTPAASTEAFAQSAGGYSAASVEGASGRDNECTGVRADAAEATRGVDAEASPAASIDNALRAANDAFGTSIGRESIGLYSPQSVRGFSPYSAGNIRVEGLYIDAVALPNNKLVSGNSIRVGPIA